MTDHKDRATKAQETALRKQHECETEFGFKRRTFVKVTSAGSKQYLGRVGRLMSYNDLRDAAHPRIAVEAAVVFTAGENQTPVFFEPKELESAQQPASWGLQRSA